MIEYEKNEVITKNNINFLCTIQTKETLYMLELFF